MLNDGAALPQRSTLDAQGNGITAFDSAGIKTVIKVLDEKVWIHDPAFSGGADPTGVADSTAAVNAAKAVVAAAAGGRGGILAAPSGTFKMSGSLTAPSKVHWRGQGQQSTIFSWAGDIGSVLQPLAANVPAIDASGAANQSSAPTFRDLQLLGPNTTFAPNSARAVLMDGLKASSNQSLEGVFIQGFGAGLVMWGDHIYGRNVKVSNNYYNQLYPSPRGSQGNHTFVHLVIDGASHSCIAVGGDVIIDNSIYDGGHCGNAPYGIYKGDQFNLASTQGMINQSGFHEFSFEGIGNAGIMDASTGTGSGQDSITNVTFDNPGFVWDGSKAITAAGHDYCVDVRSASGFDVRQGSNGFIVFPASGLAAFRARVGWNGEVEMSSQGGSGTNVFGPGCTGVRVKNKAEGWDGRVKPYTGTLVKGDLLMFDTANANTVKRNVGTAPDAAAMPAGVAALDPVAGSNLVVATQPGSDLPFTTDSGTGTGRLVVPDTTNHHGTTATPTGKKVFGVCTVGGGSPSMKTLEGGWASP